MKKEYPNLDELEIEGKEIYIKRGFEYDYLNFQNQLTQNKYQKYLIKKFRLKTLMSRS